MSDVTKFALLADTYYETREKRLAMQRAVDAVEKEEKKMKAELIAAFKEHNFKAIGGHIVTITHKLKKTAIATDWNKVHEYIIANDAWDIMQKRLTQSAIDLRWEDKISIPGVEAFPVDDLSISTVRG